MHEAAPAQVDNEAAVDGCRALEKILVAANTPQTLLLIIESLRKAGLYRSAFLLLYPLIDNENYKNKQVLYELSILAYYQPSPWRQLGAIAAERIIVGKHHTALAKADTMRNIYYYAQDLHLCAPSCVISQLVPPVMVGGFDYAMNPSILSDGANLMLCVRFINYHYELQFGTYKCKDFIDTANVVYTLTPERIDAKSARHGALMLPAIGGEKLQYDGGLVPIRPHNYIRSYEDVRLFRANKTVFGVATSQMHHEKGLNQMILLRLSADRARCTVHHLVHPLAASNTKDARSQQPCEKNWTPLVVRNKETDHDRILFIYSHQPFMILSLPASVDDLIIQDAPLPESIVCEVYKEFTFEPYGLSLSGFRGGSQAIWLESQQIYLYIVHEVSDYHDEINKANKRRYYHRFVQLSPWLEPVKRSPLFYLKHRGIEFVAGIAQVADQLYITLGYNDAAAYIAQITLSDALAMCSLNFREIDTPILTKRSRALSEP